MKLTKAEKIFFNQRRLNFEYNQMMGVKSDPDAIAGISPYQFTDKAWAKIRRKNDGKDWAKKLIKKGLTLETFTEFLMRTIKEGTVLLEERPAHTLSKEGKEARIALEKSITDLQVEIWDETDRNEYVLKNGGLDIVFKHR